MVLRHNASLGHGTFVTQMGDHRLALVTPARQHDRRPEGLQLFKMLVPVRDCAVEDRTKNRIGPDPRVKFGNELREVLLG